MRCWLSSERTTNPSSRRKRQDSLSLSLVLFPPKPLRWVSAGALLGEVIKLPFCIFSAFLCGGGITTLGVRFMPLKRWTPAGHGGLFAVFMPSRNLPRAGRISPRRVHTPPQPLTAHTAAHTPKHGVFSPPETSAGSIGSTAWVPCASSLSARRSSISRFPLLRRTTAEMPILLSAATLCRIR